ncbi:acetylornithine deacetylase [Mycolicibacterium madagascariense]|uniref:Acetylornithine deacetylase n=2 Tax=Mycolicibacterium madagascariense TaxID=212765 RepID=A0A7I7X8N3_9MYCO|nr:acetylornithine deacetylase [Mycolicibacterium madagascariense]
MSLVERALTEAEPSAVELLRQLVRRPSLGPHAAATREAMDVLAQYLRSADVDVTVHESSTGVATLLAQIDSGSPGPNVLLQGHMDVVPVDVNWERDPFDATVDGGYLHGRGACDMKAGIASFAGVLSALRSTGSLARGSVTLLIDADEETGSDQGLIPYIGERGLAEYDWAICAEPTALQPYLGNRGLLWITVTVTGKAAHAGIPSAGHNPIPLAAKIIADLPTHVGEPGPHGCPPSSLTVTTLHSGTVVNSIPDEAVFTIDRRLVPGESAEAVFDEIDRAVRRTARSYDEFSVAVSKTKQWPPCLLPADSPLALAAQAAAAADTADPEFGFDEACNDASFLSAAGVPTIVWGPGDPGLAHTSREKVAVADVGRAMRMYASAIARLMESPH